MSRLTKEVRDLVDSRDEHLCVRCGVSLYSKSGSRHHRKLRSQGGKNIASVLILLCGSGTTGCHGWVHANPEMAREGGWYVRSWEVPSDVAVRHAVHGWVYLDDDGGYTAVES